jgi:RimJ/RimL family protein N-acetyltransferase
MPNLDPSRISVIQPTTPEDIDDLAQDIMALYSLEPDHSPDFIDCIRDYPHYVTLFYIDNIPAGLIHIGDAQGYDHLGKDSLEFSGAVLPEYRETGLTQLVSPTTIRQAFLKSGKKKMLAKTDEFNQEARMALNALGFKHIGRDKDRNLLYKLDRKDALA